MLRRLGGLVVVAVITLISVEALLWLQPIPFDQMLGFGADPREREGFVFHNSIPGVAPQSTYRLDARGVRSIEPLRYPKPPGTFRVICLGASTTEQGVQSVERTWCGHLQTMLRDSLGGRGPRVETGTVARSGVTAFHLERWAHYFLASLEPDLVIVLMGINDLTVRGGSSEPVIRSPASAKERCQRVSQLCRRLTLLKRRLGKSWGIAPTQFTFQGDGLTTMRQARARYRYDPAPNRPWDPIEDFEASMDRLVTGAKRWSIDVIVAGQPVLWKARMSDQEQASLWFGITTPQGRVRPSPGWLLTQMSRYNRTQEKIAQRHGADYVDLDAVIPKDLDHYYDDCHTTDLGSQAVARALFGSVMRRVVRAANGIKP
jgi:lysophospholipase L1-like esterase